MVALATLASPVIADLASKATSSLFSFLESKKKGTCTIDNTKTEIRDELQKRVNDSDADTAHEWQAKAAALGVKLDLSKWTKLADKGTQALSDLDELSAHLTPGQMKMFAGAVGSASKGLSKKYPTPAAVLRAATAAAIKRQRAKRQR